MRSVLTEKNVHSLFDIQVNGFAGVDFQRNDLQLSEARLAIDSLRQCQTHRILVTLISDRIEALLEKLKTWEILRSQDPIIRSTVAGYHIEGPYLSELDGYHGAHPPECMKDPDVREWALLSEAAGGNIRMLTLAPERRGSEGFIAHLRSEGVVVALGHTNADELEIDRAIIAGAQLATHLGNGVPSFLHRHRNVIQHLLARDELIAAFIPDGIHLPPTVLKNFVRCKGSGKVIFTTDAMAGAGAKPGLYTLGKHLLSVGEDHVVRQPGADNFAGSALTPNEGVQNANLWTDLDKATARAAWSTVPAELCGVQLPQIACETFA